MAGECVCLCEIGRERGRGRKRREEREKCFIVTTSLVLAALGLLKSVSRDSTMEVQRGHTLSLGSHDVM